MDGYKNIIRSRSLRLRILKWLSIIPDSLMLRIQYFIKFKRFLDLKNPRRFTEKLQLYKIRYKNPVLKKCIDKYLVREYIESKGLSGSLNELYGIYYKVDEIDFNNLPDKFVIKTTNGGGGINIILCKNKNEFDFENIKLQLKSWLKRKKSSGGREWAYTDQEPKVIIEKYLENEKNPEAGITDYKFFCFNGKAEYVVVDIDRYTDHRRNFYDMNWNYIDISSDCTNFGDTYEKPAGFEEMKSVAAKLSEDFPFVRVDLYYLENLVIFGELTFYPWSGYVQFKPDSFDFELGSKLKISDLKYKNEAK